MKKSKFIRQVLIHLWNTKSAINVQNSYQSSTIIILVFVNRVPSFCQLTNISSGKTSNDLCAGVLFVKLATPRGKTDRMTEMRQVLPLTSLSLAVWKNSDSFNIEIFKHLSKVFKNVDAMWFQTRSPMWMIRGRWSQRLSKVFFQKSCSKMTDIVGEEAYLQNTFGQAIKLKVKAVPHEFYSDSEDDE